MKLSYKLILGFIASAVITLIVGAIGFWGVSKLDHMLNTIAEDNLPATEDLLQIQFGGESIKVAQRTLLIPTLTLEERKRQYDNVQKTRLRYKKYWDHYDGMDHATEDRAAFNKFSKLWKDWANENNKFLAYSKELDTSGILNPDKLLANLQLFRGDHYKAIKSISDYLLLNKSFEGGADPTKCNFGKWLAEAKKIKNKHFQKIILKSIAPHNSFHKDIKIIKNLMAKGKQTDAIVYYKELEESANEVFTVFKEMREYAGEVAVLYNKMHQQAMVDGIKQQRAALNQLQRVLDENDKEIVKVKKESENLAYLAELMSIIGMIGGTILAVLLGVFLARIITRPITEAVKSLTEASHQVTEASNEISSSAQQLADGASQQASSVEEINATIEQAASINTQSSDNIKQANNLGKSTTESASNGYNQINELSNSMSNITEASQQIAKIIKTIDEIAFQTNLLALNAAVEAARAGEHGLGFAVVADEVKGLAQRSADAAKETAQIIEKALEQIKEGSSITDKTNEAFQDIMEKAAKTSDLIGEMTESINEQSEGMQQIATAIGGVDRITQQNAANSEEAAAASEELNAQAQSMMGDVARLALLIGLEQKKNRKREKKTAQPPKMLGAAKPTKSFNFRDDDLHLDEKDFEDF